MGRGSSQRWGGRCGGDGHDVKTTLSEGVHACWSRSRAREMGSKANYSQIEYQSRYLEDRKLRQDELCSFFLSAAGRNRGSRVRYGL